MEYKKFSRKAAVELVDPPSWVASIGPCLIAGALAVCSALMYGFSGTASLDLDMSALGFAQEGVFLLPASNPEILTSLAVVLDLRSAVSWVLMLVCAVLMQSATNTLNDYQDFKSGLDTEDTILDKTDASIVYNQINPRDALVFGLALLGGALVIGVVVVLLSSWWLLLLGLISAAVAVLYSAGPKPLSSLPLGELTSGVVMGGIITCATFYAVTLTFTPFVLLVALIPTIAISQIMLTNNTCDIMRDTKAGRKTLPILIGFKASRLMNVIFCLLSFIVLLVVLYLFGLYFGIIAVIAGFALCFTRIDYLLKAEYDLKQRSLTMTMVVSYTVWLTLTTVVALVLGGALSSIL